MATSSIKTRLMKLEQLHQQQNDEVLPSLVVCTEHDSINNMALIQGEWVRIAKKALVIVVDEGLDRD
jgi:hypothetical protein